MKIVAKFNFNGGKETVESRYAAEYGEIEAAIKAVDSRLYKIKESKEKTMMGRLLFSPSGLNVAFKRELGQYGWRHSSIDCEYTHGEYLSDYIRPKITSQKPFRDMDFVKEGKHLGVEVQFGKYAFMVYNVCAKMTIFKNLGLIDTGVEIVPVKHFADEMSTGVSYFEQIAWDLEHRGISNIDVPVLILGIDA